MTNPTPGLASETGSETQFQLLIAQWEERAQGLEESAEHTRNSMMGLTAMYLEKARGIRACIADLKRYQHNEHPTYDNRKATSLPSP